ncbi:hypothetical protein [Microbulbifer aggregans]|uniref:hypothetical protein n=1 Tax=Microbulbifer aggregans TaxID=1769779 RepID=UPI001CFF305A|nr:hypothetical protein [Microbulbifer aggregans]
MENSTLEMWTDPESGNEVFAFQKEIGDAIRFIYSSHFKKVNVVANTGCGYTSLNLADTLNLKTPPWDTGVIILSGDAGSISLDTDEESLNKLIEWLSQHQITILDDRHEKSE